MVSLKSKLLIRQLRKADLSSDELPNSIEKWHDFLEKIQLSYEDSESALENKEQILSVALSEYDKSNRNLRDFTESLEQQVQEKTQALLVEKQVAIQASKLASLGEMAGSIAHEINNPITIIKARVNKLFMKAQANEIQQAEFVQLLDNVRLNIERVIKIIKGLTAYGRDTSQMPFEDEFLEKIIIDSFDLVSSKARSKKVDISYTCTSDLKLKCRRFQLEQVFVNLVSNAVDAIEELPEKWIKIECSLTQEHAQVRITDSGPGISSEVYDKLFIPFFTTKALGKGTGLGLSISKQIIESHKGTLGINKDSPNTQFVITLALNP